jgi:signal transduction histidine kinase
VETTKWGVEDVEAPPMRPMHPENCGDSERSVARADRRKTRSLLSALPDHLLRVDRSGAWLSLAGDGSRASWTGEGRLQGPDVREALPEQLGEHLIGLLERAFLSGQPQVLERQIVVDGAVKHYEMAAIPLSDDEAVALVHDVTHRKKLEEQMLQAQRIESFGQFAGGAAHDFNNLLTAIIGYCQLATRARGRVDTLLTSLQEIEKAAQRGAELCRQLLRFAGRQTPETQMVSLNDLVQGTGGMLRRLVGDDIDIAMNLRQDVGLINVNPGQLEQVVVNLVSNARDAMPDGGKISIGTANVTGSAPPGSDAVVKEAGEFVMLSVSDTGTGIRPDVVHRVFEAFYTAKADGEGTGLGLFICDGIVTDHGGYIDLRSEPGQGTTFEVYLPRVPSPDGPGADHDDGREPRGNETVLLVEDDQVVRGVAADVLRHHGYTVLEAGDGVEALGVIEDRSDQQVDLLFTDVVMPIMNGRELASRLREVRPEFKVLYTSGYAREAIDRMGRSEPGGAFIEKPFTPDQLARKVRAVLEA